MPASTTASRHAWFWLIACVSFVFILYELREVLLPFVLGMAIAYLCDPLADRLQRLRVRKLKWLHMPRWLATTIVLIGVFLAMIGVMLLVVPLIQAQVGQLVSRMPAYVEVLRSRTLPLLEEWVTRYSGGNIDEIRTAMTEQVGSVAGWVAGAMGRVLTGGLAVVNVLSVLVIAPVVAFYLLRDWDHMVARINSWLPRRSASTIRQLATEIDATLAGFVRGQALVCLSLALFYGVSLSIVRLDYALIIGLTAGLVSFIPYIGTLVGFVTSVGVALGQYEDKYMVGVVVAIFVAGQIIEGNVVQPLLVGDRIGLHPVWIIFALLAGGSLFGFLGVLIAVPAAAVIGVLVRYGLRRYLASPFFEDTTEPRVIITDVSEFKK